METYFQKNMEMWDRGYDATNTESWVFRPYGRIFKPEFGLDGSKNERVLDFGCGQGATARFFHSKGFDAYGVDISVPDIAVCQKTMPQIADHFAVIEPKPKKDDMWFGGNFDLVIGIQSFYYFNNEDYKVRIQSVYDQMKPGGYIYASMIGTKCWYYANSTEYKDGLRNVTFSRPRLSLKDYYCFFTASEEELLERFKLFKRIHVGYYDAQWIEGEGSEFHYTFIGQKE